MKYTEQDYLSMKTPLSYQITEYDCGSTSILNGVRYLLKRGEIPVALLKGIELYTLDTYDNNRHLGGNGTSSQALEFISNWINNEMCKFGLNIKTKVIKGKEANITNKDFNYCMNKNGVAIFRVWDECHHYVLCTKIDNKCVYLFDPYYCEEDDFDDDGDICLVMTKPFEYNRIVSRSRLLENDTTKTYSLVQDENQVMLLMYRE